MIILTQEQADGIRGRCGKFSEIQPVLIKSGEYILPEAMLNNPDIPESVKAELRKYPVREVTADELIDSEI